MRIDFVCTGGTIDKDYPKHAKSFCFEIASPAVKRILTGINPNFEYKINSIMRKDSLEMTAKDRQRIFDACKKASVKKLIVTHGTDTIVKTAEKLSKLKNKAIVLVGSSLPERFHGSDAHFNIGVAIGAVTHLKSGVFVAMNGRVYEWDKVKKISHNGRFVDN